MYQNLPAYVAWQGHGKQGNHTPRLSPVHIAKCLVISHGQQNACVESTEQLIEIYSIIQDQGFLQQD